MNRHQRRHNNGRQLPVMGGYALHDINRAHEDGYSEGWHAACGYCMRVCYAAAVRAAHQLEGYGTVRNKRFLRLMDEIITCTLTSDEAIEAALKEAGVEINFREVIPEERVV